jgi:hypothetical protein
MGAWSGLSLLKTSASIPTAVYRFEVAEKESPRDRQVGSQHYPIPFTTDVWISVASGEILKIARKSITIPADTRISDIDWDVSLAAVNLSGKTWSCLPHPRIRNRSATSGIG